MDPEPPEETVTATAAIHYFRSWKKQAQPTYWGGKEYQPVLASWAEMDLAVTDEFRDGNVPAHASLLAVTRRALQAMPETMQDYYIHGDSGRWEGVGEVVAAEETADALNVANHPASSPLNAKSVPGPRPYGRIRERCRTAGIRISTRLSTL